MDRPADRAAHRWLLARKHVADAQKDVETAGKAMGEAQAALKDAERELLDLVKVPRVFSIYEGYVIVDGAIKLIQNGPTE